MYSNTIKNMFSSFVYVTAKFWSSHEATHLISCKICSNFKHVSNCDRVIVCFDISGVVLTLGKGA